MLCCFLPSAQYKAYLSQDAAETLIHSFITSRVDYCNGLLHGLPAYQLQKLQRVQNAAARLIFMERKYCHITPLLQSETALAAY